VRAEGKKSVDKNTIAVYSEENKSSIPSYGANGKAIPLQAWTGPESSRRLRLPDFKTFVT
jgi:hypothetical protein